MAAPLYFFSKLTRATLFPQGGGGKLSSSLADSRGVAGLWADCKGFDDFAICDVPDRGPDGSPGVIVTALPVESREPPRRIGYLPANGQAWSRIGELTWIGIDKQTPPVPADLQRREQYPGHRLTLGDGNEWLIPALHQVGGKTGLPEVIYHDWQGVVQRRLRSGFEALWAKTLRVVAAFSNLDSPDYQGLDDADALDLCLDFLSVNYRVGRGEAAALELFDRRIADRLLYRVVDGPRYDRLASLMEDSAQKKSDQSSPESSSNSATGYPGDTQATDPPLANSNLPPATFDGGA